MIGQNINRNIIETFIDKGNCPRFIIITGVEGSGKRTFAKYISDKLNAEFLLFDNKVESVRNVINMAYTQNKTIVYCIYGYETMSIASKNALLKVAEEPPTNTYIILTATNKNDVLDTLISRAILFDMEDYTKKELEECAKELNINTDNLDLCEVPLDIIKLQSINQEEFKAFINNVWDKIGNASIGNSLKLTNKLKIKEESDGYDVLLFINAIGYKTLEYIKGMSRTQPINNLKQCRKILELCYETKNNLNSKYNKQALMDKFIMDLGELRHGII